ncbi:MAG: c-type cytochrome domain-containing protein, partial [Verrucomicrobiota bacterium]
MNGPVRIKIFSVLAVIFAAALWPQIESTAAIDLTKLPPAAARKIDFAKDIQPIFLEHCYQCHGPKKQEASLRWDEKSAALKGGESGMAIIPGKSTESLMIQAVAHIHDDLKMPKKGEPLSAEKVGLLRAWIDQGADWPDNLSAAKLDAS